MDKKKESILSLIYKRILNIDILFTTADVVKDLVIVVIVVSYLINNILLKIIITKGTIVILFTCLIIMLIPTTLAVKWMDKIFNFGIREDG